MISWNREKILDYTDGRCSPEEANRIKEHISACVRCKDSVDELLFAKNIMGKLPSPLFEENFEEVIAEVRGIEKVEVARPVFGDIVRNALDELQAAFILRPVPAFAKAVVTIALIVGLLSGGQYVMVAGLPQVISTQGEVQLAHLNRTPQILSPGARIKSGDTFILASNANVDIELAGRYKTRLKGPARITVDNLPPKFNNGNTTMRLQEGVILAGTLGNFKGSSITIDTPTAKVNVKGTKFMVDYSKENITELLVGEGTVSIGNRSMPESAIELKAGQKTSVTLGARPQEPVRFTSYDFMRLREIHCIGRPAVIIYSMDEKQRYAGKELVVSLVLREDLPRVRAILAPYIITTNNREPRQVKRLMEKARRLAKEGREERNREKTLEAISLVEEVVSRYPDERYNPQFLTFIASYYELENVHEKAIEYFKKVTDNYPDSELASIALCAAGIIEEKIGNLRAARKSYEKVLSHYPYTPESIEAKKRLSVK